MHSGEECGEGGNNTNMGQGTRDKSIQKVAATWPFFYFPRVRLFVFILFFHSLPVSLPLSSSLSLPLSLSSVVKLINSVESLP